VVCVVVGEIVGPPILNFGLVLKQLRT